MGKDRDWKKITDYEYLKNLKPCQWAWEFLRRNAEYIKEFKELIPEELERRKELLSDPEIKGLKCFDGIRNTNPDNVHFSIHFGNEYCLAKYGILYMVNPKNDNPFPNPFRQRLSIQDGTFHGGNIAFGNFIDFDIEGDYIPVVFDVTRPIKPQIQHAQKQLLLWQKDREKNIKIHKIESNWTDYIRILDAKAKNIIDDKIAKVIFPTLDNVYPNYCRNDNFRKALKRAKYLSEKGYREIAMLH